MRHRRRAERGTILPPLPGCARGWSPPARTSRRPPRMLPKRRLRMAPGAPRASGLRRPRVNLRSRSMSSALRASVSLPQGPLATSRPPLMPRRVPPARGLRGQTRRPSRRVRSLRLPFRIPLSSRRRPLPPLRSTRSRPRRFPARRSPGCPRSRRAPPPLKASALRSPLRKTRPALAPGPPLRPRGPLRTRRRLKRRSPPRARRPLPHAKPLPQKMSRPSMQERPCAASAGSPCWRSS